MIAGKDNNLLVEFEFIIDLDLAMYRYIRENFYNSPLVNKKLMNLNNLEDIIKVLLYRNNINPLEILIPNEDTTNLYYTLLDEKYNDLLEYATIYDTFALMITFLKEASSVAIDVLCKSKIEADFIHNLNSNLHTVLYKSKTDVLLNPYTVLYTKYFVNLNKYRNVEGKHIYIPAAKYNMEKDKDTLDINLIKLYSGNNELHLIDLYKDVKFRFERKESDYADIL